MKKTSSLIFIKFIICQNCFILADYLTIINDLKYYFIFLNIIEKMNNNEGKNKVSKQGTIILNKTIQLINVKDNSLSKICSALLEACSYIHKIEGSSDRKTMRKYLKNNGIYKGK